MLSPDAIVRKTISRSREILRIIALVLLAGGAEAQQVAPEWQSRNWDVGVFLAGATGEENTNSFSEAQILGGGVSVGRALIENLGQGWRRGQLEWAADFLPLFLPLTPERIYGIGFDPIILRWNSTAGQGRIWPFLELGGGGLHTNQNLPPGDTSTFNFMVRGGGGVRVAMGRAQALEIGARWLHISNANLGNRNPEFNGIQVSLGWHWFR